MTKYEWESELKKNVHRLPAEEIRKILEYYDEIFADKIERGLSESEIVRQFGNPVDVADKILSEYDGELKDESPVPTPDMRRDEANGEKPRETQKRAEPEKSAPLPSPQSNNAETPGNEKLVPPAHGNETDKSTVASGEEKLVPPAHGGVAASPSPAFDEPLVPPYKPARAATKPSVQKRDEGLHGDRLALFLVLNIVTGFVFFILVGAVWIVLATLVAAGGAMALGGIAGTVVSVFHALSGSGAAGVAQIGGCVALCGIGLLFLVGCIMLIKLMAKGTAFMFSCISGWICPKNTVVVGGGEKA